MTYTFTQLVFGFLCGMLYVAGYIFGLSYEEISVYVCIYLWPALCVAMPTIVAMVALYNWVKKLTPWNTINLALSSGVASMFSVFAALFYQFYSYRPMYFDFEARTTMRLDTIHDKFVACWSDLTRMANDLGMTYEEVNLWVYCYLFMAIALVMWLWFEITIPRRWILNRLWLKKRQ